MPARMAESGIAVACRGDLPMSIEQQSHTKTKADPARRRRTCFRPNTGADLERETVAIGDASGVGVRGGLDRDPVAWLGLQKGIEDCDARRYRSRLTAGIDLRCGIGESRRAAQRRSPIGECRSAQQIWLISPPPLLERARSGDAARPLPLLPSWRASWRRAR